MADDKREPVSMRFVRAVGVIVAVILGVLTPIAVLVWIGFIVYSGLTAPNCPDPRTKAAWVDYCMSEWEKHDGSTCVPLPPIPEGCR